jgi:integrase
VARLLRRQGLGRLRSIDRFFTGRRADQITSRLIADYIVTRQGEETISPILKIRKRPSAGTINRELGVLGRMLRLAAEQGRLVRVPVIHKPEESKPRAGFFEPETFEAVRAHLSLDLQVATALMYDFAWRLREVLNLELRQVDLDQACIRLDPGSTKNKDGRVVFLRPALVEMLKAHVARVRELERETGRVIRYLSRTFPRPTWPSG